MVGLAREKRLGLEFGDVTVCGVEFLVQVFQQVVLLLDVGFFLGQMDVGLNIAGDGNQFFVGSNLLFGALAVSENTLCGFLIVPEIGVGDARFEGFQALAILRGVKDSSARA